MKNTDARLDQLIWCKQSGRSSIIGEIKLLLGCELKKTLNFDDVAAKDCRAVHFDRILSLLKEKTVLFPS